jgi:hypothetical protein
MVPDFNNASSSRYGYNIELLWILKIV